MMGAETPDEPARANYNFMTTGSYSRLGLGNSLVAPAKQSLKDLTSSAHWHWPTKTASKSHFLSGLPKKAAQDLFTTMVAQKVPQVQNGTQAFEIHSFALDASTKSRGLSRKPPGVGPLQLVWKKPPASGQEGPWWDLERPAPLFWVHLLGCCNDPSAKSFTPCGSNAKSTVSNKRESPNIQPKMR